jgi:elongation factor Ts
MVKVNLNDLKKLREETQASIADCRRALEESEGDYKKALDWIKKHGIEKASKKEGRETSQGIIDSYIHANGRIGVITELLCETDFVAKTEEFKNLAHEISMQVASMNPKDVDVLLSQDYIRDPSLKISDLIKQVIGKLGENIAVKRFKRFEIGEE